MTPPRPLPKGRHVPSPEATDEAVRERAAESCGFRMGVDLFDARRQINSNGGPEAILDRAARRAEKGSK